MKIIYKYINILWGIVRIILVENLWQNESENFESKSGNFLGKADFFKQKLSFFE